MIGTHNKNSDVWVYLKPEDILKAERGGITGDYINVIDDILGTLAFNIKSNLDEISDVGEIRFDKSEDNKIVNLEVSVWGKKYEEFRERGSKELHLGYAHIHLLDISKLSGFNDKSLYHQLCLIRDRLKQNQ